MAAQPAVHVVDDDPEICRAVALLAESIAVPVITYSSAEEFLQQQHSEDAGCLVLDIRMPGMSGIDLQKKLASVEAKMPVIVITGYGEIPLVVESMQLGAMDFLEKPFSPHQLLERIQRAIVEDAKARDQLARRKDTAKKLATLSPREREVMKSMTEGLSTKQIATQLGLSTKTVDNHRASMLRKMGVGNVAELMQILFDLPR